MKLIVGLGNPGSKYNKTRHNIGFAIIDAILEERKSGYKKDPLYLYAKDGEVIFLKPLTYMNLSGTAVAKVTDKFEITTLLVIYDDIYLPLGEIRIREKGSDGGHKGIRSILEYLEDSNFTRLRIGIGSPEFTELSDFVLANFTKAETKVIKETKDFACRLIEQFILGGYKQMIDYFSKNNVSYSEKIQVISESQTKGGKK